MKTWDSGVIHSKSYYLIDGTIDERISNIRNFAKIARKVNLEKVEEWKITVEKFVTKALIDLG